MSLDLLKKAHEWLYKEMGFTWKSDISRLGKIESWEVLDPPYVGDCEDAALTIMNRLLEQDVNSDTLSIVRCATKIRTKYFDHAILLFIDDDGNWYFSDCLHKYIMRPSDLGKYLMYDAVSLDNLRGVGKPKLIGSE
jgi:predicted transglutaminase-like cysteine proteinase